MKNILEWASYVLAVVGFGATVYKTIEVWLNLKNFSWGDVDKYSKVLIKKIAKSYFVPDVIVGIGRGGAIIGSILSGNIVVPSHQKESVTATFQPDYFGKEILADFNMPWMYKGYGYSRDSRRPPMESKRKA